MGAGKKGREMLEIGRKGEKEGKRGKDTVDKERSEQGGKRWVRCRQREKESE